MDQEERWRKHKQAIARTNVKADPNQPGQGDEFYLMHRERAREEDCNKYGGWACGWHAADYDGLEGNWDRDIKHNEHYTGEYHHNLWDDFGPP